MSENTPHHQPTPVSPWVRIDRDVLIENLAEMADYAQTHKLRLRPHIKTHKLVHIAELQLEFGATGLTVSTTAEALMASAVCDDILLAYPVIDPTQVDTLARLAGRVTLRVAIDSFSAASHLAQAARRLGNTIHLLTELDVGVARTGLQSPAGCTELALRLRDMPGIALDGIMIYPGHVPGPGPQQARALTDVNKRLDQTIRSWRHNGLKPAIVSGGSTPTALLSHRIDHLTEIRPGTYVFNDMNCVNAGLTIKSRCAATIRATVVSDTVPGQVVVDAGSKTLSSDLCGPAPDSGHGCVVGYPHAVINKLYEEHGLIDVKECQEKPALGEVLTIIPNHICPCINLQERVWLTQNQGKNSLLKAHLVGGRR